MNRAVPLYTLATARSEGIIEGTNDKFASKKLRSMLMSTDKSIFEVELMLLGREMIRKMRRQSFAFSNGNMTRIFLEGLEL